ncbi:hypothetical protein [Nocardia sp. NBC_00416]|uniref:hypothetical protein n=1 Tax=Nocardia sp. NBC_00416 TaxID=2975991 RepID=UPI002E1D6A27
MIRSTIHVGIRAVAAAAIAVAGLGAVAVGAGTASATGAGGGGCLASRVFEHENSYTHTCVTANQPECRTWASNTAAATGGIIVDGTCVYVQEGLGGWPHPAGFYGAVGVAK